MSGTKNSILLDVDDSELKKKLLVETPENMPDDFESLLPFLEGKSKKTDETPWKWVQPSPGICVKTYTPDEQKIFINICHTSDIPSPHNLDEETLLKMYASLDDDSPDVGIRVPLSIGDLHEEFDKSGEPARAYDVAVSSEFLERAQSSSRVHLRFLVQVAIESVSDKYKLELNVDQYTVLKNRKVMGKLQRHRIEQRGPKMPLIQELGSSPTSSTSTSADVPPPAEGTRAPERTHLVRRSDPDGHTQVLVVEFTLADVMSAAEVTFRVGEDRLRVESARRGYSWDAFLPMRLDADAACATFVRKHRVLNVQVPIVSG